ncbi:hypothetical protein K523DRAFT_370830 [Schizophyllum commune Tattone D]|nr:hypothetical protein K523DRAFT_370830 [Schizophyllum commune Tattone D]
MPGVAQQDAFGSRAIGAALEDRRGGLRLARGSPYGRTPYDFTNQASTLLQGRGPPAGIGTREDPATGGNQATTRARHLIASSGLERGRRPALDGSETTESTRMHLLPL